MRIFRRLTRACARNRLVLPGLVLLSLTLVTPLAAIDQKITVLSSIPCSKWVKDRKEEAEDKPFYSSSAVVDSLWLNGFLTGLNTADPGNKDLLGAIDAPTIVLWVDRHCQRFPNDDLYDAGRALFKELKKLSK
jgi:hypothetical protein